MQDIFENVMIRAFKRDIVCFCVTNIFWATKENEKKTVIAEYYVFYVFCFFCLQIIYLFKLMSLFWLKSSQVWQLNPLLYIFEQKMSVFLAQLVDRFSRYLSVNQKKKKKTSKKPLDFLYVFVYKSKSICITDICKTKT